MGEAKVGEAFITHEFDEAIAVQQVIVDAETTLSTKHPQASAKRAIKSSLQDDKTYLTELKALGKKRGATGKVEDVAGGLKELMEETLETATKEGADSDFYEAHAVLLNIKRKQMDSAGGMLAIARDQKDTEARDAAAAFHKAQKASCASLSDELAAYAVVIVVGCGMTGERSPEPRQDAGDVVEGEIGEARLRQPDAIVQDGTGADLDALGMTRPDDPLQTPGEDDQTEMDRHREAGQEQ